jgi:Protein of unknown function (DUF3251)
MNSTRIFWWLAVPLLVFLLAHSCSNDSALKRLRKDVRELKRASVTLTQGPDNYQVVRHELGAATISLKQVKANANGSALTLEVGNASSIRIAGFSMEIGFQDPIDAHIERSLSFNFQETLEPGRGTTVTLVLQDVDPARLGYIRVSNFRVKGILL